MSEEVKPGNGKHVPVEAPTVTAMTAEEKAKFNFWDNVPPAEKLDIDEFYHYDKRFSVVSSGLPTDDAIKCAVEQADALFKKGFKLRYNRVDSDILSEEVYYSIYNKNKEKAIEKSGATDGPLMMSVLEPLMSRYVEVYTPWESFGNKVPVCTIDSFKPTYRAHALCNEYHGSFKTQQPNIRRLFAVTLHHIFGGDCATPINLLMCYSDCGTQSVKEIKKGVTGNVGFPVTCCEFGQIPVFNLRDGRNRTKLEEVVKDIR